MYVKFRMLKESLGLVFVYREFNEGSQDIQVFEVCETSNGVEYITKLIFTKECEFAHSRRSFEKECSRIRRELKK